jgi:hypothetical protein
MMWLQTSTACNNSQPGTLLHVIKVEDTAGYLSASAVVSHIFAVDANPALQRGGLWGSIYQGKAKGDAISISVFCNDFGLRTLCQQGPQYQHCQFGKRKSCS